MTLEEVFTEYSKLGFAKYEGFIVFNSALDIDADPSVYLELANKYGMSFTSIHLPPVTAPDSIEEAVKGARFAKALGASIVLFKAASKKIYIEAAPAFLDQIEGLGVTPVLQNHAGSPISTLEDFREVIEGINDSRMKTLLEVGHFHNVGVSWKQGYDFLGESIALIHIKDQIGKQSVPFGTGEIDLPGLFAHMRSVGYDGDYVIEMEVADRDNTLKYIADAIKYIRDNCMEDAK